MTKPLNDEVTHAAITKGAEEALGDWLMIHDYSSHYDLQDGVERAVSGWLQEHTKDLIKAIAEQVAEQAVIKPPPGRDPSDQDH
ncbi:hypothetical protein [Streptomyces sp. NPDC005374]|uniref:hypothetical protein n=1 Tax=Streptomyces sp. NPDC005374 TaxID=3364713 RepID=UPI00368C9173